MKILIFIVVTVTSCLSFASDLSAKLNCELTFEQTRYVNQNPVVQTQSIPLQKGQYNSSPPATFISGRFQLNSVLEIGSTRFDLHIQDIENAIAISFTKIVGDESHDLIYIRLKPKDSLDIRIPVSPREGPIWDPLTKELHLVCESNP